MCFSGVSVFLTMQAFSCRLFTDHLIKNAITSLVSWWQCNASGWLLVIELIIYCLTVCIDGGVEIVQTQSCSRGQSSANKMSWRLSCQLSCWGWSCFIILMFTWNVFFSNQTFLQVDTRSKNKKTLPYTRAWCCIIDYWNNDIILILMELKTFSKQLH